MQKRYYCESVYILLMLTLIVFASPTALSAATDQVPVRGVVTMIDLGARKCIPCKMMAPILVKLEREYAGRAAIVFLDVWEDRGPAYRFGIRTIPTQIFFDKKGTEVYRHEGFLSEEAIVRQLKIMGVK